MVNATPIGMSDGESPIAPSTVRADLVVADLVYHPLETPLLAAARAAGARPVDGLGMLVHQAALQVERWSGRPAPVDAMRAAVRAELERRRDKQGPGDARVVRWARSPPGRWGMTGPRGAGHRFPVLVATLRLAAAARARGAAARRVARDEAARHRPAARVLARVRRDRDLDRGPRGDGLPARRARGRDGGRARRLVRGDGLVPAPTRRADPAHRDHQVAQRPVRRDTRRVRPAELPLCRRHRRTGQSLGRHRSDRRLARRPGQREHGRGSHRRPARRRRRPRARRGRAPGARDRGARVRRADPARAPGRTGAAPRNRRGPPPGAARRPAAQRRPVSRRQSGVTSRSVRTAVALVATERGGGPDLRPAARRLRLAHGVGGREPGP